MGDKKLIFQRASVEGKSDLALPPEALSHAAVVATAETPKPILPAGEIRDGVEVFLILNVVTPGELGNEQTCASRTKFWFDSEGINGREANEVGRVYMKYPDSQVALKALAERSFSVGAPVSRQ